MVVVGTSEDAVLVVSSRGVVWWHFTAGLYTLCGLMARSGGTTLSFPPPQWYGVLVSVNLVQRFYMVYICSPKL